MKARLGAMLVAAALQAIVPPAAAVVDESPADARGALRIDGWALSAAALQALHRAVRVQQPQATLAQVVEAAVQDRLLGRHALESQGDARLFDAARVAFSPQAMAEASLVATLQAAWREPLKAALGREGIERFVVRRHPLTAAQLSAALDSGQRMRLDDRLAPEREAALREVMLLDYRFDGGPLQHVSLHDVWQRLDVQGRNALYRQDAGFAMQQALGLVRDRHVLHWARAQGGLTVQDLVQLQQLMADRERRGALARLLGAGDDPHFASQAVARARQDVTAEEIARYYAAHRDEFVRVERVGARSLRCPDEACAEAARAELAQGQAFEAVARRHGGDGRLRWIEAAEARSEWAAQLAFAQPPGAPVLPVREPLDGAGSAGWWLVRVEQRVTGFHPPDSETVRFAASEAIARRRAVDDFASLGARLLQQSHVEIDPAQLGFGAGALHFEGGR